MDFLISKINKMKVLTESQKKDLKILADAGYNPIAISKLDNENVFVFNTILEVKNALHEFGRDVNGVLIGDIIGWWYDRSFFKIDKSEYEYKAVNNVIWLDNDDSAALEFPLGEEEFEPPYFHTSSLILDLMEENDYSIADLAGRISESADVIRSIITEKSDVTVEIANKLSKVFGKLPEHWLRTSK